MVVQTNLVNAEVPFLCGKQTLESWNFKNNGREKVLEIETKLDQDCSQKLINMIDTAGGHYRVILETKKRKGLNVYFSGRLFWMQRKTCTLSRLSGRSIRLIATKGRSSFYQLIGMLGE